MAGSNCSSYDFTKKENHEQNNCAIQTERNKTLGLNTKGTNQGNEQQVQLIMKSMIDAGMECVGIPYFI